MASCTICGVSFPKPEQVRGHIQGSGGEHAGIGFQEAEQYISDARDEAASEADPAGDPPADPASSPSSSDGLGVPQGKHVEADAEQKDDPTCPDCGGNKWFDASTAGYDYGCPACSTGEKWTVWSQ